MKPQLKTKLRNLAKRLIVTFLPVFSVLFILLTTAVIIALISGYSFDIRKRTVVKTGVLNVETSPNDADISITGTFYGKSNRAIPNLKVGTYAVMVEKAGYFPYSKTLRIYHGLATPLIVPLLRTDGQKEIRDLTAVVAQDYNQTGYYLLDKRVNPTQTATATPAKVPNTDPTITYTLTRVSITKPLFDDPQPSLDESMTITTLAALPITGLSVSPTGKLLLVTITDKSGQKSIALIPFKVGTTINANLATSKPLTNYAKAEKNFITWTENGDYLLVETPTQLISYNAKSGSRVILAEKRELAENNTTPVWNKTANGIVSVKKVAGTNTNTYEIIDLSYNGNPLTTQLPLLTFESPPTKIWSFPAGQLGRYVVSTKTGTYFVGALYDTKSTENQITLSSTAVGTSPLTHIGEEFSVLKVSDEEIAIQPVLLDQKHALLFFEGEQKKLVQFIYNKRIADPITQLGKTLVLDSEYPQTMLRTLAEGTYVTLLSNNTLYAIDRDGDNLVPLQQNVKTFTFGQNDSGLLFTDSNNQLLFRVVR